MCKVCAILPKRQQDRTVVELPQDFVNTVRLFVIPINLRKTEHDTAQDAHAEGCSTCFLQNLRWLICIERLPILSMYYRYHLKDETHTAESRSISIQGRD